MATAVDTLVADVRSRSAASADKLTEARARLRKAEEESAWREYERARKFDGLRAETTGKRAARFVAAAE
jgi:hypothetical protein